EGLGAIRRPGGSGASASTARRDPPWRLVLMEIEGSEADESNASFTAHGAPPDLFAKIEDERLPDEDLVAARIEAVSRADAERPRARGLARGNDSQTADDSGTVEVSRVAAEALESLGLLGDQVLGGEAASDFEGGTE